MTNNSFVLVDGEQIASNDERLSGLDDAFQAAWRLNGDAISIDLATAKAIKKSQLAEKRWAVETGGMTVSGMTVSTDRDSQGLVTGAAFAASLDDTYTVKWKTAGGFIDLDAAGIIGVAQAIRAHVQGSFDHEATIEAAIDACATVAELDAVDINAGWD